MARFYRFETVDIPLKLTPVGVLENYSKIVVSIAQEGMTQINKDESQLGIDVGNDIITLSLSQEETSKFAGGNCNNPRKATIQVNIYYESTERDVSTTGTIDVYDNLYKEVISNE